jgi:hypothetical protein
MGATQASATQTGRATNAASGMTFVDAAQQLLDDARDSAPRAVTGSPLLIS